MVVTVAKLTGYGLLVNTMASALGKLPIHPPLEILWSGKLTRRLQALFGWGDVHASSEDVGRVLNKAFEEDRFDQLLPMVAYLASAPPSRIIDSGTDSPRASPPSFWGDLRKIATIGTCGKTATGNERK